jgi:D-glycero-D-manno-heptose 1,7-bisphosphate phosphatase
VGVAALTRVAVFLDRDGVLNRTTTTRDGISVPPARAEQLEILEGVREACKKLRDAGCLLIVVTNQPDVARGTRSRAEVERINTELLRQLPLDCIKVCYHDNEDHCVCRKPAPGLLLAAAEELDVDLSLSFMVGDRSTDVEAGRRAGCRTVIVRSSAVELVAEADYAAPSLVEAANWITDQVGGSDRGVAHESAEQPSDKDLR